MHRTEMGLESFCVSLAAAAVEEEAHERRKEVM